VLDPIGTRKDRVRPSRLFGLARRRARRRLGRARIRRLEPFQLAPDFVTEMWGARVTFRQAHIPHHLWRFAEIPDGEARDPAILGQNDGLRFSPLPVADL
jgi:hypothetical protein